MRLRPPGAGDGVASTVTTFLLLHGAASSGWYWHLVEPILQEAGHDTVAPDLPAEDPGADLSADVASGATPLAPALAAADRATDKDHQ